MRPTITAPNKWFILKVSILFILICKDSSGFLAYGPYRRKSINAVPRQQNGFSGFFSELKHVEKKLHVGTLDGDEDSDGDDGERNIATLGGKTGGFGMREHIVPPELDNQRIDAILAALEPSFSRSICGKWVVDGRVRDENRIKLNRKSLRLAKGTVLRVNIPQEEATFEIRAQKIPLNIVYEDEHMIVLNKAAGMVVHPAAGNWNGTVVNALAHYLSTSPYGCGEFMGNSTKQALIQNDPTGADGESLSVRPGIVHRLDKGTTGLLVVAKTVHALGALSESFASRNVTKTYLVITVGNPGEDVVINKPIGRHPINRQRMRVVPDPHRNFNTGIPLPNHSTTKKGREALSYVNTLAFDSKLSVVEVRIATGRTHQIRVHLQDRKTPVYGDEVYGIASWNEQLKRTHGIKRALLHSFRLEIDHPVTGERMKFVAPMAQDMQKLATAIWPEGKDELPDAFNQL